MDIERNLGKNFFVLSSVVRHCLCFFAFLLFLNNFHNPDRYKISASSFIFPFQYLIIYSYYSMSSFFTFLITRLDSLQRDSFLLQLQFYLSTELSLSRTIYKFSYVYLYWSAHVSLGISLSSNLSMIFVYQYSACLVCYHKQLSIYLSFNFIIFKSFPVCFYLSIGIALHQFLYQYI